MKFNFSKALQPNSGNSTRVIFWWNVALAFFMFVYLLLRAIYAPLVIDEATTYLLYVKTGYFLPGAGFWSANNHYLNSFLMWLTSSENVDSYLNFRAANLISFVFFAYWLIKIAQQLKSVVLQFLLLPAIFSVHYLIEFFAFARGYGLMLAFFAGSLYYAHQWHTTGKRNFVYKLALCIFLMVASSLSVLPAAGMLSVLAIVSHIKNKKTWLPAIPAYALMVATLVGGAYITSILGEKGELYYGGKYGFWQDSVVSLGIVFFNTMGGWTHIVFASITASLIAAIGFALHHTTTYKKFDFRFAPLVMVVVAILFYHVAHSFLDVLFPMDRTLLYLFLLTIFALFFTVDVWLAQIEKPWPIVLLLPFIIFPITFPQKLSIYQASANGWSSEQVPATFINHVKSTDNTVGGYFLRHPQWDILQSQNESINFSYSLTSPGNTILDFVLSSDEHLPLYSRDYEIIDTNHSGNLFMLKRNQFLKRQVLQMDTVKPELNITKDVALFQTTWQPNGDVKAFEIDLEMKSESRQFTGVIGISGVNEHGEVVFWKDIKLGQLVPTTNVKRAYRSFVPLNEVPQNVKNLTVFLWNTSQQPVDIYHGQVKLLKLTEN